MYVVNILKQCASGDVSAHLWFLIDISRLIVFMVLHGRYTGKRFIELLVGTYSSTQLFVLGSGLGSLWVTDALEQLKTGYM